MLGGRFNQKNHQRKAQSAEMGCKKALIHSVSCATEEASGRSANLSRERDPRARLSARAQ